MTYEREENTTDIHVYKYDK